MSHDTIITSFLAALSFDYFKQPLFNMTYKDPRHFHTGTTVPFGARLITEVIGCVDSDPQSNDDFAGAYLVSGDRSYDQAKQVNKFVRILLNDAVLNLGEIRGGSCSGRDDGFCELTNFVKSQDNAVALANFQHVCYGNYSSVPESFDEDGTFY